ncbi:MAG: transposase, partial [Acidobacteriales bacterium]|nr:transposase [Terriglobales bacterium]
LFQEHHDRWWSARVDYHRSNGAFLRYISRYLCRPPLAEYRLRSSEDQSVSFLAKDKKLNRLITITYTTGDFIAGLADQVPDHYRHGVRYFGLLAPRCKSYVVFWKLLSQVRRPRPRRISWAESIRRTFGRDPLLDSTGHRMYRVSRIATDRCGVNLNTVARC